MLQYNTIQYKFYCQLPMRAFQRQVLIVQVIKKKKVSQIDYQQTIKKLFTYKFMTLKIDLIGRLSFYVSK